MYIMIVLTLCLLVLASIYPPRRWHEYVISALALAFVWWAAYRETRKTWIEVDDEWLRLSDLRRGLRAIPRHDVTRIEAHGLSWRIHDSKGRALEIMPVWTREQLEALASELRVPVHYGKRP